MSRLFAGGGVIDWIIAAMLLEAAGLAWWHFRTGRGPAPGDFLATLLSGFCLLVAMRLALGGMAFPLVGASLLAALAFHVADLRRRWPK